MTSQEIQINDALQELEVTKFHQVGRALQLTINQKLLIFYVDKNPQKTLDYLKESANEAKLDDETLAKLKHILARDYLLALQFQEYKSKDDDDGNKKKKGPPPIKIVEKNCQDFFIDNLGQPFAAIKVNEHIEIIPVKHKKFRSWITKVYFDATCKPDDDDSGIMITTEDLNGTLRIIERKAEESGEPRQLYLRVAKIDDTIYVDMVNRNWQAIKVTSGGWEIVYSPPIFKRRSHQRAQVIPDRNYPQNIFDDFIGLMRLSQDPDNKLLFQCYIISLFYHGIVHAALMLHGEGGTAKTTRQKLIRLIVDPSATLVVTLPKSVEKAAHVIVGHYVCYFDNISKISDELSDLLCTAITGAGIVKRELYTDDDDIINEAKHCLGLTGVNLAATKTDLIDRGLIIEAKVISEEEKKREEELYGNFHTMRPGLLGYILDTLVRVLKWKKENPNGLQLAKYPRLADWAEICEIISRCIGNLPMAFIDAYNRNIKLRHRRIVNDSAVGRAIEIFIDKPAQAQAGFWKGDMSTLLSSLSEIASTDLKLPSVKNAKYWPQAPNVLSRKINEIKDSLRAIDIQIDQSSGDTSLREYTIRKKEKNQHLEKSLEKISLSSLGHCSTSLNNDQSEIKASDTSDNFSKVFSGEQKNDKKVAQILGTYLAFDLEWDSTNGNIIDAASFVDSDGNEEVKLRGRDFGGSEASLLDYIQTKLLQYRWSIGWNTQGRYENSGGNKVFDLLILHDRCQANSIPCIIKLGKHGLPYIVSSEHQHIDLLNVYSKEMVKDGMYNGRYRTNRLHDVSNALLGYGKYNNYSGAEFKNLSIEEQVKYSLQDSKLVMDLSKYRDFEALDSMLAIAEITGLDFERICQTRLTTWWGAIFDKMVDSAQSPAYRQIEYIDSPKGAKIIPPKKGMYHDVVVVDAQSLYPSVAIKYNLSFDTINCQCCYDNPQAKISKIIPKEFTAECKYIINPTTDWICQKRDGAFPSKLKGFKEERLKQKQQGSKAKAHALKILINGGYGVFGHRHFRYFDGRVAELVTATGRYTLAQMQQVAENEYGFEVIYGDTDSLFLNNTAGKDVEGFTQRFRQDYDISLEVKNKYDKLLLSAGEKHYIGVEKGKIDNVGYEGEKSDRCQYFHTVYDQLLDDMLIKEIDPVPNVKKAFTDLQSGQIDPRLLIITQRVNQEPGDYVASARVGRIAKVLNANKGDLVHFYNANEKQTGKSWTLDPTEIDYSKYKELLWNTVSEILQIAGCPVADLAREFGIKIKIKVKSQSRSRKKESVLENYRYSIADNKTGSIGGGK